jgi:hypothetical protein
MYSFANFSKESNKEFGTRWSFLYAHEFQIPPSYVDIPVCIFLLPYKWVIPAGQISNRIIDFFKRLYHDLRK